MIFFALFSFLVSSSGFAFSGFWANLSSILLTASSMAAALMGLPLPSSSKSAFPYSLFSSSLIISISLNKSLHFCFNASL